MAKSVYEMVTERIIEQLENNIIPWENPWTGVRSGAYNRISKKPYSLLNQMLLQHDGEYTTFKQWQDLGGHVRKLHLDTPMTLCEAHTGVLRLVVEFYVSFAKPHK